MTTNLHDYDALFVINQDCSLEMVCSQCNANRHERVFVLTTHALLDNELEIFRQHLPVMPEISTFASLLSDADMEKCDEDATKALKQEYCTVDERDGYNVRFMKRSIENKNRLVRDRIMDGCHFKRVYHSAGLGIDPEVWRTAGGSKLNISRCRDDRRTNNILGRIRTLCAATEFHEVGGAEGQFIFLSSVRRLHLEKTTIPIVSHPVINFIRHPGSPSKARLIKAFLSDTENTSGKQYKIATTIHEYQGWMSRLGRKLYVFVDGYHPENYPRTYIDGYNNCIFVTRNMFDCRWFEKFGMQCLHSCSFIQPEYFNMVERVPSIGTVVLLLNHAGDWSALINRSDTDLLIRWFANSAALNPKVRFIVRPHPTMIHPSHEGCNSIERIHSFVTWRNLQNLEMSEVTLDEDFARGDFFVSEYSQTLLDVYRGGLPGLIVNCTKRRSFMADYEAIGFPALKSADLSGDGFRKIIECPDNHISMQNLAVSRYNKALDDFMG